MRTLLVTSADSAKLSENNLGVTEKCKVLCKAYSPVIILIKPDVIYLNLITQFAQKWKILSSFTRVIQNLYSFLYFEERKQMFSTFFIVPQFLEYN